MQVSQILKSKEKARIYYEVILPNELFSLRWLSAVGFIMMSVFIVIDYWRATHFGYVILFRGICVVLFIVCFLSTYASGVTVKKFHYKCYLLSSLLFISSFFIDYYGGVPAFFLPNATCLFAFGFNTTLGHPARFKMGQMFVLILMYVLYAFYLSSHRDAHIAQSFNVALSGILSCLIGFFIERHRIHNFVHRAQLLESRRKNFELNKLKTKLISILSHDVASPLNSLVGLLHLRDNNLVTEEELANHSEKVRESLSNLSSMLGNLVRWSKSQLEGFQPVFEHINAKQIVDEVTNALGFALKEKDLTIKNEVQNPDHLVQDKEILKIVVRNFLTNAVKFSHPGGMIVFSSSQDHDTFTLGVKDFGVGMDPEKLEKLFTPGKNSSPGTRNETGTGIGLLITKDFVEMMGGSILVKSEPNKGAEFLVKMPLNGRKTEFKARLPG